MRTIVLAVATTFVLAACARDPSPQDQRSYIAEWKSLRTDWESQEGNAIRRGKAEEAARAFFRARRPVSGWTGSVTGVNSALGSTWVDVENSGMQFMLRPEGDASAKFMPVFERLSPGDRVVFDGTLATELSLTMAGGIRHPEVSVTISRVERR